MAEDVGSREERENLRQKAQKTVGKYKGKANKDKDLSHELALKNQSMRAQLQSTRESMDRMASQVQRSKERMESLTSQIEESDEPLEKMRSDLETLLQKRLEVKKDLAVEKSKVDENEHVHLLDILKQGLYDEDWLLIEKAIADFDSLIFDDFDEFMDICRKASGTWGNKFTYTLLESKDIK